MANSGFALDLELADALQQIPAEREGDAKRGKNLSTKSHSRVAARGRLTWGFLTRQNRFVSGTTGRWFRRKANLPES